MRHDWRGGFAQQWCTNLGCGWRRKAHHKDGQKLGPWQYTKDEEEWPMP